MTLWQKGRENTKIYMLHSNGQWVVKIESSDKEKLPKESKLKKTNLQSI